MSCGIDDKNSGVFDKFMADNKSWKVIKYMQAKLVDIKVV